MTRWVANQKPWGTMPRARAMSTGAVAWASAREIEGVKIWMAGTASTQMPTVASMVKTPAERSPRDRSSRTPRTSPAVAFSLIRVNSAVTMEVTTSDWGRM
ncbi:hypothetical protein ACSL103130_10850 [Actinomyces slackii]